MVSNNCNHIGHERFLVSVHAGPDQVLCMEPGSKIRRVDFVALRIQRPVKSKRHSRQISEG
jgi:hypothetical protein